MLHPDASLLPHGLRLFVKVMGLDDAVNASSEEQGNLFFIPDKPTPNHEFCKRFSVDMARALYNHAGSTYQIPKLDKIMIQLRNIKLREDFKQGASVQDLVRRYKLTRQMINIIVTSEVNGAPLLVGDAHKQMELKL
ncbi:Mor transcription activator family protein [Pseudoalteromonas luteoviolacea]|uniref:Mor transcription activator family n=1 Tax=Pseudoalteromonas luteoviolacea (strain 2ta16) TaxID=1353533 RepID=V4H863_PSEL2|nr:Mor transcription activator family protein [Pseudoalteromonas luteoviolacea]ESP93676.1 Mor transcription activator family [Pseudoalteromonas luteoviolacea 2ta16]KZN41206.1 hypothetical protein N483_16475 [Pseudoalteromonas luteoviolacea NCIMB 1944]